MSDPPISATIPDWDREKPRGFWDPGPRLLGTIRRWHAWGERGGLLRRLRFVWALEHRFWSVVSGAEIYLVSRPGGGLQIPHPNGIVIHPWAVIGPNCLIHQQVTLGTGPTPGYPVLGGDVAVGAGAKVLGGVRIGDHAKIGANAVVIADVPASATAVGVPARIVRRRPADAGAAAGEEGRPPEGGGGAGPRDLAPAPIRGGSEEAPGPVRALILAAGLGTRLRPLTDRLPKCLVPIAGRPLLDEWVDRLAAAGVGEARVNTHAHADQVRGYVAEVARSGRLALSESYEPHLLGSAGTVAANADLADGAEHVVIVYADNFSDVDLKAMLAFHRAHGDPFTMLLFRAPDPRACGIAELDGRGRVVAFVEKPKEPKSDLANGGVYIVTAEAYREIAAMGAFDLGFEVLPRFVGRMRGWAWEGYHLDIGTHEALAKARRDAPGLRFRAVRPRNPGGPPAAFLDRDGTIIEQVHYLDDPGRVRLLPGAAEAIRRLRAAGFACVVVTNQSAIGRGMLTPERLGEIHEEMNRQLAAEGAELDAIEFCPEAPEGDDRRAIEHADRKPGPGMLFRAAERLGLDLDASWMVGDMISDALAGLHAGCRGSILVRTGKELSAEEAAEGQGYEVRDDLLAAAGRILGGVEGGAPADVAAPGRENGR